MDKLLKNVLSCMRTKGLLDKNEEDVYRFGLECLLLEVVHYLSYIVIGFAMRMIIPMIVTAMVLIPLRRKSGGFHARTRSGCYLFSCSIVVAWYVYWIKSFFHYGYVLQLHLGQMQLYLHLLQ